MINLCCANKILCPDGKREGMEKLIANISVFRENALCLYCDVPIRDLHPVEGTACRQMAPGSGQDEERIPYLICRDDEALLSFAWLDRADKYLSDRAEGLLHMRVSIEGLLHLWVFVEEPDDTARLIKDTLEKLLSQPTRPAWFYQAQSIPTEFRKGLEKERMLARCGLSTLPTEYGRDNGIIRGYRGKASGIPRCGPFCSEQTLERLADTLKKRRTADAGPVREQLSFAQRIEQLNRGLPGNSGYSMAVVRRFANMRLDDYMRDFPKELAELREYLPDHIITYRQAAAAIHQMLLSAEEQEDGQRLMRNLAQPMASRFREKPKG